MRNLIVTAVVSFILGHYWKHVVDFVKAHWPKKK